jgi:radical SAM protein with 4Fe4S-binding SPASM domain
MGAPQFRLLQRRDEGGPILAPHGGAGAASLRAIDVDDGNGCLFVSHVGDVFPSRSLPIRAGNVRAQSLPTIYRASALFRALRDPSRLEGKCAACSFKRLCGGSHARLDQHGKRPRRRSHVHVRATELEGGVKVSPSRAGSGAWRPPPPLHREHPHRRDDGGGPERDGPRCVGRPAVRRPRGAAVPSWGPRTVAEAPGA